MASVEYRPGDQPDLVRSDLWLDGKLYCPACLERLEADRPSLVPSDSLSDTTLVPAREEAMMRRAGYTDERIVAAWSDA